jgi:aspartyl-tRNA synthetase
MADDALRAPGPSRREQAAEGGEPASEGNAKMTQTPLGALTRTHYCGELRVDHVGQRACLMGWVHNRRDHGGVVFLDVRDRSGKVQVVFRPEADAELSRRARELRGEDVVAVVGSVGARPEPMRNPDMPTGDVELLPVEVHVLNTSLTPPFEVSDEVQASEELRLRYRYLDLRRPSMQRRMILRHRVVRAIREYLNAEGFVEIETPLLTRSTPEGARDYLVPSRIHPGMFYALAQSPQMYKQLLMVAGFDRYYQIARCMRDEDQRGDRQPEHTQIDVEMSFAEEQDVMRVAEGFLVAAAQAAGRGGVEAPFPRLAYQEALARFGTDKPDLRFPLEFLDVTGIALGAGLTFLVPEEGSVARLLRCSAAQALSRRQLDEAAELAAGKGARFAWTKWIEEQPTGPLAKALDEPHKRELASRTGWQRGEAVLAVGGSAKAVAEAMCAVRAWVISTLEMKPAHELAFLWVTDFPLFSIDDQTGKLEPAHHMFTMPRETDIPRLESEPLSVMARHYDLVCNGVELASGSVRIHRRDLQERIMRLLGMSPQQMSDGFGFLLEAFEYGAPPHAGIAPGIDRIVMILAGQQSIREVIAFPKTLKASSLLMRSPTPVSEQQLKDLHLKLDLRNGD